MLLSQPRNDDISTYRNKQIGYALYNNYEWQTNHSARSIWPEGETMCVNEDAYAPIFGANLVSLTADQVLLSSLAQLKMYIQEIFVHNNNIVFGPNYFDFSCDAT